MGILAKIRKRTEAEAEDWPSPNAEVLARAVSRLCWRRRGETIAVEHIERDAGLALQGNERRAVWREVADFYATNADVCFLSGGVIWKRSGPTTDEKVA